MIGKSRLYLMSVASLALVLAASSMFAAIPFARPAFAHVDPDGDATPGEATDCTGPSISQSLRTYRPGPNGVFGDGDDELVISGSEVIDGELLATETTLGALSDGCAEDDGTFTLELADGSVVPFPDGSPCIGGTTDAGDEIGPADCGNGLTSYTTPRSDGQWTVNCDPALVFLPLTVRATWQGLMHGGANYDRPGGPFGTAQSNAREDSYNCGSTSLSKSANVTSGDAPLAVLYTYNETNDGNVPLTGVSVTDDSCAPVVLVSGDVANPGVLDPGESWVFTCTVVLTTAGTYTNTAIASGTTLNGRVVTYNQTSQTGDADEIANATVTVTSEECTILTKTADKTIVEPGDTITYTITEFNCGTAPIGSVVVTDSYKGDLGAPSSGDAVNPGVLDPGETWTWTYTRTVTAEDSCPINNNVTATGVNLVKDEDATPENASATVNCRSIGGEILGVDAAALLIAGAGANVFTILPILGAIAGAAFFAVRRWK